jgi:AcrR family transcriptional regulator
MHQSATPSVSGLTNFQGEDQAGGIKAEFRGRPRSEESEEAILAAIIELLSEKPLRDISMEEIARKAGVGKATIYKWWPSKAYVALDAFLKSVNQRVPTPDTGSTRRDIQQHLRSAVAFYRGPAGHILGQFVAECQIDKEFASLFRQRFVKPRREQTGVIFDRGVERGEIDRNLDRELVLDLIYGSAVYRIMVGHNPLDREVADRIISILFGGLDNRSSEMDEIQGKTTRKRDGTGRKPTQKHSQKG